ncbi:ornithine cyclodeaminase family protein [Azohydromonas caseinilytica]|uniref:Ornithine cyclodeaminase family protein n=1 Tax=Azohydromonas caseinilytica TaxID=2728836 RepID=A0A848FAS0_9BURK|nr:ornithine cyclodeaminase family protein [Azohydromonas caseinilytica]NML15966.1 ornithine cyclodeaminase family protein [Azohydromonas caseinilytica]
MKTFDAAATAAQLPFERLIPALSALFADPACQVPARHVHEIAAPDGGPPLTSLLMPAWLPGRCYGVKIVNIAPGNAARGLPGLHGAYLLFDAVTGVPLALMDGDEITSRRTAAASALAATYLARPDARWLLVLGTGRVASLLPAAYAAVRPIEEVRVWARSPDKAQALAESLRAQGFAAEAAPDLAAAVAWAHVVSCATLAREPLVQGAWLAPASHLDLIGSFTPEMREADDDCFRNTELFVDTEEALRKSGDLLGPLARGVITPADLRATLADLCRRTAPGRRTAMERTVFKSVGTALEDLAAAMLVQAGG